MTYLQGLTAALAVLSLSLVVLPDVGGAAFSALIYQQRDLPAEFSAGAREYVQLTNAVLGAVMAGWFTMMFLLSRLIGTVPRAWEALVLGLAVWFVPDTVYSLASGFWQNAVLNTVILTLFAPALLATRPRVTSAPASSARPA